MFPATSVGIHHASVVPNLNASRLPLPERSHQTMLYVPASPADLDSLCRSWADLPIVGCADVMFEVRGRLQSHPHRLSIFFFYLIFLPEMGSLTSGA